ncbi:ABC transporter substrate-binding protein [Actinotalea sp. K2]|uniref:ABC transporter substrate-binding protein n=1 Tax=Actinotalea sp. K2 TaxID=2939438 RepID=UPI0020178C60|nr:extracellular solute-binding protein [Actinotalea sp. K2]MCL3861057.1 extracellular solute-binding protein [Actinotalea sp. K2]
MRTRTTALAAITALALAGCSSGTGDSATSAPDDAATTEVEALSGALEFMTGTSIDSELYLAYEDITEAFESANPDVSIELVPSSTDHEGEVKTRLASGNTPDLWMTHGWSLLRYSEFLMPLTDELWAKDVNPALDPAMRDGDGAIYALPLDVDVAGLLYNADVLASVGVTPEDIRTWEDFTAACDEITAAGKTAIYTAGKDRWPTGLFVDWIAPGAYDEAALGTQADGTLVPESYQVALDKVAQFRDSGYFNPDYTSATSDDISLALAQGDTGFSFLMNFVAVTAYTYNPDANVGFMPIPSASGGDPYLVVGEKNAIGISSTTESPDAARAYLAFLAQPDNGSVLAKASGSAPGLTTATSDLGALQASHDAWVGKVPSVPYFDRVYMPNGAWDTIVSTTEGVLTNQMSVSDAMAKVATDFDSLTAQAQS